MVEGIGLENRHTLYVSGVRIPSHPNSCCIGHVAQLVEQLAYNEKVSGSSPLELIMDAGVVELVDTPGLGSGGYIALRVQVLPSVDLMIRKNG